MADDLTGAVDLASCLAEVGLRTLVVTSPLSSYDAGLDAVVVALKTRTTEPQHAVTACTVAAQSLLDVDVETLFFKYCSTFDSTPSGNIGPVADALLELTGARLAVVAPGYPANGRTVFMGHLFVGTDLLAESGMRTHPLTPMTESDVVRLMAAQSAHPVGRAVLSDVRGDLARRFGQFESDGVRYAVVDTVENGDLDLIADACAGHRLVTGGAGLGQALARRRRRNPSPDGWVPPAGGGAIVAGSCSPATRRQVEAFARHGPVARIDPRVDTDVAGTTKRIVGWALDQPVGEPLLVTSTTGDDELAAVRADLGAARAAAKVEELLGAVAVGLVDAGVGRLVVAGGETAGAVVAALRVGSMRVTTPIGPGLAWCETDGGVALALKSGNFGTDNVFRDALALLEPVVA